MNMFDALQSFDIEATQYDTAFIRAFCHAYGDDMAEDLVNQSSLMMTISTRAELYEILSGSHRPNVIVYGDNNDEDLWQRFKQAGGDGSHSTLSFQLVQQIAYMRLVNRSAGIED